MDKSPPLHPWKEIKMLCKLCGVEYNPYIEAKCLQQCIEKIKYYKEEAFQYGWVKNPDRMGQ